MSETLAKFASLVCLLVALTGCRGASAPAPYFFLDHLENAEVTLEDTGTNVSEWKLSDVFAFRSETRRALADPGPAQRARAPSGLERELDAGARPRRQIHFALEPFIRLRSPDGNLEDDSTLDCEDELHCGGEAGLPERRHTDLIPLYHPRDATRQIPVSRIAGFLPSLLVLPDAVMHAMVFLQGKLREPSTNAVWVSRRHPRFSTFTHELSTASFSILFGE